jgi:hypothetical protein
MSSSSLEWQPPKKTYAILEYLFDSQRRFSSLLKPTMSITNTSPPTPPSRVARGARTISEISSPGEESSASSYFSRAAATSPRRVKSNGHGRSKSNSSSKHSSPSKCGSPSRHAVKVTCPSPLRRPARRPLTVLKAPNTLNIPKSPAKNSKEVEENSLGLGVRTSKRRKEALAAAMRKLEGRGAAAHGLVRELTEAEEEKVEEQVWEAGGEVTCVS